MIVVNHWADQFMNYINMGYRNCPPQKEVSMHLGPLMHVSWLQTIDDKDPKNKNLEQLVDLIKEDGKLRMPRHQRR